MREEISKKLFNELVLTGRIGLDPEEAESLRHEMNQQMNVIRQLESIPLEETVPPVIHGNPYPKAIRCELREDVVKPFPDAAAIISAAPLSRDGFIVSPDVAHQKIG